MIILHVNFERFDKYTSTLTRYTRSYDETMQTRKYYKQVYRCEKVDKKYYEPNIYNFTQY